MLPFHQLLPKQENTEKRLLNRSVTQSALKEEKLLYHYCTFVTGMSDEEDELNGFRLGAADYIKKPFSQKILLARISNLLKQSGTALSEEVLPTENFTETERRVAELIMKGYNGKEICDKLFYSYSYVKKLLASMREKSGCETLGDLKKLLCGNRREN